MFSKWIHFPLISFFSLCLAVPAAFAASPYGKYKRPDGSVANVWKCGQKMCGKVVSGKKAGFNMFLGGIRQVNNSTWKGNMKHPKMGKMFTFNGTVKQSGNTLHVQGCMIGGMMCDAETWRKM